MFPLPFLFLLSLLLTACSTHEDKTEMRTPNPIPISPDQTPLPSTPPLPANAARVNRAEVLLSATYPPTATVATYLALPDTCTILDTIQIQQQTEAFNLILTTQRKNLNTCQPLNAPVRYDISLPLTNLYAGLYWVNVNGIINVFELPIDNHAEDIQSIYHSTHR